MLLLPGAGEFGRQERLQSVQAVVPETAIAGEPGKRRVERGGTKPAVAEPPRATPGDDPRLGEHVEVLGHSRLGDGEFVGKLHDGVLAAGKPLDDAAAGGIGERVKDAIEGGRLNYNHVVI